MNNIVIGNYKRISLSEARKIFNSGEKVYVVPSKCSPESQYHGVAQKAMCSDFTTWLNQFRYYNCNAELGKDVFYYKKLS